MSLRTAAIVVVVFAACLDTALAEQTRRWTDSTGSFTVDAEFLDFQDGQVRMRKLDGFEILVPIEKLSLADQGWVNGRPHNAIEQSATRALAPFPAIPDELEWSEAEKKMLQDAAQILTNDPVSPYITLKKLADKEDEERTDAQSRWFQQALESTRPEAMNTLSKDFDNAIRDRDLHRAHVALQAAEEAGAEWVEDRERVFQTRRDQILTGEATPVPVWRITEARGRLLDGNYTEDGFNRITVSPKDGCRLMKVTARVENICDVDELVYASAALRFGDTNSRKGEKPGPSRIIQDDFLCLSIPNGERVPCQFVCDGCRELRAFSIVVNFRNAPGGMVICGGTYVPRGDTFELEAIFSVPDDENAASLLVFGAVPIPLELTDIEQL